MSELILLTDGSVNAETQIGYGAYLVLPGDEPSLDGVTPQVHVRRFEQTSSTKLELQTLLWALEAVQTPAGRVTVYTDSQNSVGLPGRRERLERADYRSAQGRRLNNYALYQEFYRVTDQIDCQFIKIRGHLPSRHQDEIARLFTLVDRAARQALRNDRSICIQGKERDDETGRNEN